MIEAGSIEIEQVDALSDELVEAMRRLTTQLSASAPPLTRETVAEIVGSSVTTLFVARSAGRGIVGMLTLALFRIPTGVRAWIEDVVVDEQARGRGIGEALTDGAIRLAVQKGARTVDLTSRPDREEANRLYERTGFERRQTSVYRFTR